MDAVETKQGVLKDFIQASLVLLFPSLSLTLSHHVKIDQRYCKIVHETGEEG